MYKDIDYNPMKGELRKFYEQYQESSKGKNVEQLWTESKDKIHSLMNEHILVWVSYFYDVVDVLPVRLSLCLL
jgi:hypothetical protein